MGHRDCPPPRVAMVIGLLALLAHRAAAIQCWTSTSGLLKHPSAKLVNCQYGMHFSCFEHYHALKDTNTIMYEAGCGPYLMSLETQLAIGLQVVDERGADCYDDGCNRSLMDELQASHRACHWANRGANFTEAAVACVKNESRCYLDSMIGAERPAYFAGCGPCPSYTLYCSTCASNFCNNSTAVEAAPVARKIVYVDHPSDRETWFDYAAEDAAPPVAGRCCPVAMAALPALVLLALASC